MERSIDAFDLLTLVCQRAVTSIDRETLAEPAVRSSGMFMALLPNAIRACQLGKEVRVLMGAGYAAAATSRWRTIHEVHVVTQLLSMHGEGLAQRYLDHAIVEKHKLAGAVTQAYKDLNSGISKAMDDIEQGYQAINVKYANGPVFFKKVYGWINRYANPDFASMEQAANLDVSRAPYRLASDGIHPNIAGAFAGSRSMPTGEALVLGPSPDGMREPGAATAIALTEVTGIALKHLLKHASLTEATKQELALTSLALEPLGLETTRSRNHQVSKPSGPLSP